VGCSGLCVIGCSGVLLRATVIILYWIDLGDLFSGILYLFIKGLDVALEEG